VVVVEHWGRSAFDEAVAARGGALRSVFQFLGEKRRSKAIRNVLQPQIATRTLPANHVDRPGRRCVDQDPAVERDEATMVPIGHADEVGVHDLLVAEGPLETQAGWFGQGGPVMVGGMGGQLAEQGRCLAWRRWRRRVRRIRRQSN